jgi:endonuclease VIII
VLAFPQGEITIWSASLKYIDGARVRDFYDFSADILSDSWDAIAALAKVRKVPNAAIADVLLDQQIFAGVGNIIKNEVLFRTRTNPFATVGELTLGRLKAIVADARTFSFCFLEWRRAFALRSHLEIYGRSTCPRCQGRVSRRVHGERRRRSFFCETCQHVSAPPSAGRKVGTRRRRDR